MRHTRGKAHWRDAGLLDDREVNATRATDQDILKETRRVESTIGFNSERGGAAGPLQEEHDRLGLEIVQHEHWHDPVVSLRFVNRPSLRRRFVNDAKRGRRCLDATRRHNLIRTGRACRGGDAEEEDRNRR
jgi:hypothetical protein